MTRGVKPRPVFQFSTEVILAVSYHCLLSNITTTKKVITVYKYQT